MRLRVRVADIARGRSGDRGRLRPRRRSGKAAFWSFATSGSTKKLSCALFLGLCDAVLDAKHARHLWQVTFGNHSPACDHRAQVRAELPEVDRVANSLWQNAKPVGG